MGIFKYRWFFEVYLFQNVINKIPIKYINTFNTYRIIWPSFAIISIYIYQLSFLSYTKVILKRLNFTTYHIRQLCHYLLYVILLWSSILVVYLRNNIIITICYYYYYYYSLFPRAAFSSSGKSIRLGIYGGIESLRFHGDESPPSPPLLQTGAISRLRPYTPTPTLPRYHYHVYTLYTTPFILSPWHLYI